MFFLSENTIFSLIYNFNFDEFSFLILFINLPPWWIVQPCIDFVVAVACGFCIVNWCDSSYWKIRPIVSYSIWWLIQWLKEHLKLIDIKEAEKIKRGLDPKAKKKKEKKDEEAEVNKPKEEGEKQKAPSSLDD